MKNNEIIAIAERTKYFQLYDPFMRAELRQAMKIIDNLRRNGAARTETVMRGNVHRLGVFDPILWADVILGKEHGLPEFGDGYVIYWTRDFEMHVVAEPLFHAMFPMEPNEFMPFRDNKPLLKWMKGEGV